jgi:hypothetical protein
MNLVNNVGNNYRYQVHPDRLPAKLCMNWNFHGLFMLTEKMYSETWTLCI